MCRKPIHNNLIINLIRNVHPSDTAGTPDRLCRFNKRLHNGKIALWLQKNCKFRRKLALLLFNDRFRLEEDKKNIPRSQLLFEISEKRYRIIRRKNNDASVCPKYAFFLSRCKEIKSWISFLRANVTMCSVDLGQNTNADFFAEIHNFLFPSPVLIHSCSIRFINLASIWWRLYGVFFFSRPNVICFLLHTETPQPHENKEVSKNLCAHKRAASMFIVQHVFDTNPYHESHQHV